MFWLRNKNNNFQLRTLIFGPVMICKLFLWFIYKSTKIHCLQIDLLSNVIRPDKICDKMIAHDDAILIVHLVIC